MTITHRENHLIWKGLTAKQKRQHLNGMQNLKVEDGRMTTAQGKDVTDMYSVVFTPTLDMAENYKNRSKASDFQEENGGFVFALFASCVTMADRFPTLTQSDLARMMFIGTYAGWADGRLKYDNGVPIGRSELLKLTGMSRNRFGEFYSRLVEAEIIAESDSNLFVNPTVFYRGNLKEHQFDISDLAYTRLFRKTARELYDAYNGRTIKQLAVLYSILPFVNFNYNVVCYNPTEPAMELIRPITIDKLAVLLGYERTENLIRIIDKIKYEDSKVFAYFGTNFRSKGKAGVIVNPRAVYAGDAKTLDVARGVFELSERLG